MISLITFLEFPLLAQISSDVFILPQRHVPLRPHMELTQHVTCITFTDVACLHVGLVHGSTRATVQDLGMIPSFSIAMRMGKSSEPANLGTFH